MSEWKKIEIKDGLKKIIDYRGFTPPKSEAGIPLISAATVKNGNLDFSKPSFISEENYKKYGTRGFIKPGDVIITTEAPAGEVALLPDDQLYQLSRRVMALRTDEDVLNNKFLLYTLLNPRVKGELLMANRGTTVPRVLKTDITKFNISIPEPKEQKAIASVLSSLDDKIDLLHRQNKTLEAMAETLFREWFVEGAEEDWEERPLSYFGDIICGKTPSKKKAKYFDGEYPFIKIPDMHGKTFVFATQDSLSEEGFNSQLNKALPEKSINVSCIATVGLVTMNAYPSQTNQQINSIIPKDKYRYYLYCEMRTSYDLLHSMASGGTATLNLNTGNFSKILISKPDETILDSFNESVIPMFDKIFKNQTQIHTLGKLRDTLLPKLMSGEVRIPTNG